MRSEGVRGEGVGANRPRECSAGRTTGARQS